MQRERVPCAYVLGGKYALACQILINDRLENEWKIHVLLAGSYFGLFVAVEVE